MALKRGGTSARDSLDYEGEDATFQEAMGKMGVVPNKDETAPAPQEVSRGNRGNVGRKRQRGKSGGERLETLDLHGFSREQALRELDGLIQRARAVGRRQVLVITGKGYRSEGGTPVLREAVKRWLQRQGKGRVERFEPAPRHLGGSGALMLTLRRRGTR